MRILDAFGKRPGIWDGFANPAKLVDGKMTDENLFKLLLLSFMIESAFMAAKPLTVMGMMGASTPPASMTSACPRRIRCAHSPIAWLPVAHALT